MMRSPLMIWFLLTGMTLIWVGMASAVWYATSVLRVRNRVAASAGAPSPGPPSR
jgi:hypothetical protein